MKGQTITVQTGNGTITYIEVTDAAEARRTLALMAASIAAGIEACEARYHTDWDAKNTANLALEIAANIMRGIDP